MLYTLMINFRISKYKRHGTLTGILVCFVYLFKICTVLQWDSELTVKRLIVTVLLPCAESCLCP